MTITIIKSYAATIQDRYNRLLPNITGVDERIGETSSSFSLEQNYPNPFNPTTTIRFALSVEGHTTLDVYDLLGRRVAQLVHEELEAGRNAVSWNAENVASGVYYYHVTSGSATQTKKLIVVK